MGKDEGLPAGFAEIDFSKRPATIGGQQVATLRMREPTVEDQIAVSAGADSVQAELTMFANLCEVSVSDLRAMTLWQYGKVQAAFQSFLE